MPVALSKCPSVRILTDPGMLEEAPAAPVGPRAARLRVAPRVDPVVRRAVPVLVAVRVVRRVVPVLVAVRVARRVVLVATIVDRVVMVMMAGRVATVSRAVLAVMVRIVPVGMARVRVDRRVRDVMATIVDRDVMVRSVLVGMERVRVVRRDVMATIVVDATSFVDRASPATKPSVAAWRCAPKAAVPRARISSRRARSAWPNSGSMRVRWTPPSCATPPKRRPSARPDRCARTVNSTPR